MSGLLEKYPAHQSLLKKFRNSLFFILVDPCFNGEQDSFESGVDCGGDCAKKCISEDEREIPWLLWADPNK